MSDEKDFVVGNLDELNLDELDLEDLDLDGIDLDNIDPEIFKITLQNEDGAQMDFEYLDTVEFEGAEYVVMTPYDEESDQVVIVRVELDEEDPDFENYYGIEDPRVLEAVYDIFKERFKDDYDFVD